MRIGKKAQTEVTQMAGFEVSFIRKRVRNINLRIRPSTGAIQVSAPLTVSRRTVETFVASRTDWIKAAQKRVLERQSIVEPELISGATVMWFGQPLELSILDSGQKASVEIVDNELIVRFRHSFLADKRQAEILKLLDATYRAELERRLPLMLDKWQPMVGVEARECRVRRMKTRWGSCNIHKARIWMSLELAKYPPECIEYVLVHELTHLLEPSHNKRFHRLVGEVMPDWKARKAQLNQTNQRKVD